MAAERKPPAAASVDEIRYRWQVLVVVMIGTMMAALDSSIVNIALPDIMADFGATLDGIEWVVTGYMLSYAVFIPLASWFKDRLGHRTLFVIALMVFTTGSLLCGMAWNLPSLIAARVLQALGGGFITPLGMAMVTEAFPPAERGRALGTWGLGVILGPALGPTLGGFLTKTVGWRFIFLVNLPIGVIVVLMALTLLRRDQPHASERKPFDTAGFLFLSLFLVPFLLGLSKGEREGWHSAFIIGCWIVAALGLTGFLTVEAGTEHGIIDLSLFKSRIFSVCILVTMGRTVAIFAATFLLPLFMQNLMGLDELKSGLLLLPGSMLMAVSMPVAGRLSDRFGARPLALLGLAGMALFMYQYRLLDANSSSWAVIAPTFLRALAVAFLVAPVMTAALNSVPTSKAAAASSVLNLIQQVAGSIGITVLATYMDHRRHYHMADITERMRLAGAGAAEALAPLMHRAVALGYRHEDAALIARGALGGLAAQASGVRAFDDAFLFGACIILVAAVPALFLPARPVAHADLEAEIESEAMALE